MRAFLLPIMFKKFTSTLLGLGLLLALGVVSASGQAPVAFKGVFSIGDNWRFRLADTETGEARWYQVGETFNGISVSAWDAERSVLVISANGQTYEVGVAGAVAKPQTIEQRRQSIVTIAQNLETMQPYEVEAIARDFGVDKFDRDFPDAWRQRMLKNRIKSTLKMELANLRAELAKMDERALDPANAPDADTAAPKWAPGVNSAAARTDVDALGF